jgi:hypothetical protein
MCYVTDQEDIVGWAKTCYEEFPTIVNNVPKSSKRYNNTSADYAIVDNQLAKSQSAIGESSNVAQLAQSYMNTFNDKKYCDAICILSVVAQCAIDNSKRVYDIDINEEIKLLKQMIDVKNNQYPKFWKLIKDKKLSKQNKRFSEDKINKDLICPMNYMSEIKIPSYKPTFRTLPMSYFFNKEVSVTSSNKRRSCKNVESLIEKYSLNLLTTPKKEEYILLRDDFENLIEDIKQVYISNNYLDLIGWLIDRAFLISSNVRSNSQSLSSNTRKNRSILLKTLYDINPEAVIKCFSKNL